MSLEERLAENTAALKELTAFLKGSTSGTALTGGKADEKATKSTAAKADDKAEKPATRTRRAAAAKVPTAKDVEKTATKFLEDAESDEDEYAARRAFIKELAAEFDIPRLTAAEEGDRAAIIEKLTNYESDGDAEDGDSDSGI